MVALKAINYHKGMSIMLAIILLAVFVLAPMGARKADAEIGQGSIIYVNHDEEAGGDGTTWARAYTTLQEALDQAQEGDQIWVAAGTYYPTVLNGLPDFDDRNKHFKMKVGVLIYGGFAGTEAADFNLAGRDFEAYETILSGDIGTEGDSSDNAYHVFHHGLAGEAGLDLTGALLDGFTITAGNATGEKRGGGMYNYMSSPTLNNVTFRENTTDNNGGAMYNEDSRPALINVTFSENRAVGEGARGGGMYNLGGNPSLTNVVFIGNVAMDGGAMYNELSSPTLTNVTFYNNSATGDMLGSAIFNYGSSPTITNSILWADDNLAGSIIYNDNSVEPESPSIPVISYSLVKGSLVETTWNDAFGTDSGGNIDADPKFMSANNLRLRWDSPAIDEGTDDPYGVEGPADGIETDLDGNPRFVNVTVDMGAYEYQLTTVTFSVGAGSGTVAAQVGQTPLDSGDTVAVASTVIFTASASAGWRLYQWDINGTVLTGNIQPVTVDGNITAVAYFEQIPYVEPDPIEYALTMEVEGQGTTTPTVGGSRWYIEGTGLTLQAVAAEGWELVHWVINGQVVTDAKPVVTMYRHITAKALFREIKVVPPTPRLIIILTIDSEIMLVNGAEFAMDVAPFIINPAARTMVPIRFVSEQLGAKVQWLEATQQVIITLASTEILLTIGSKLVLVNGEEVEIDSPAEIRGARTFVPLRFVSEILGAQVDWNDATKQVTITVH